MSLEADDGPDFDCTACGACCRFAGEVLLKRTEPVPRSLTQSVQGVIGLQPGDVDALLRMRRTAENRCVALIGTLGQSCGCEIYERRPLSCREFQAGSLPCLGCRDAAGL